MRSGSPSTFIRVGVRLHCKFMSPDRLTYGVFYCLSGNDLRQFTYFESFGNSETLILIIFPPQRRPVSANRVMFDHLQMMCENKPTSRETRMIKVHRIKTTRTVLALLTSATDQWVPVARRLWSLNLESSTRTHSLNRPELNGVTSLL